MNDHMPSFTQTTLDLCLNDETQFDNFLSDNNLELVNLLKNLKHTLDFQAIYLWGNSGAGKTHLLNACCYQHENSEKIVYLDLSASIEPIILENLDIMTLICIDNLDCVINNMAWEEALFHLFNRIQRNKNKIIIAASASPHNLNFVLPDLKSRMLSATIYQVHELNDQQKLQALQLRAKFLGLELSANVGLFLLTHCERDMHALFNSLRMLDKASLVAKRKLTIPFVKEMLHDTNIV